MYFYRYFYCELVEDEVVVGLLRGQHIRPFEPCSGVKRCKVLTHSMPVVSTLSQVQKVKALLATSQTAPYGEYWASCFLQMYSYQRL